MLLTKEYPSPIPQPNDWHSDISSHEELLSEYLSVTSQQADLMVRIRGLKDQLKGRTDRAEIVQTSCLKTETDLRRIKTLEDELDRLDRAQEQRQAAMSKIEARVLTKEPSTPEEANTVLRFVARVLSFDRKIEMTYLSDVLEVCTLSILNKSSAPISIAE